MIEKSKENLVKQLPEGITEEMIRAAKLKHGDDKVKFVDLPLNDEQTEFLTVLAAVPSRTITSTYRRFADSDPKKADEIIVKNCLLSHKEQVLADDGLFYAALNGIAEMIPMRKGIVKNC